MGNADTSAPANDFGRTRLNLISVAILTLCWFIVYLSTVSPTVNFIDSGELITAVHEPGIAHPPGYPLYTLLGYVVSHLPLGEVAWRVNLFSAVFGALAVGALFLFILQVQSYTVWVRRPRPVPAPRTGRKGRPTRPAESILPANAPPEVDRWNTWFSIIAAGAGASILAASDTFWSRTAQAKMYTLHYFFISAVLILAINHRWAYERGEQRAARRWLVLTAAALGLSFTNHLMTSLLVPGVLILLLGARDGRARARWHASQTLYWLPAFLAPLLLYLYLPLRSAQRPVMNWGSPGNFPDFWRHVTGWQYRVYLSDDLSGNMQRVWGYMLDQWAWLSLVVILLALAAGALVARTNPAVFFALFVTGAATIAFSLKYGISEMAPYIVPLYLVFAAWLGSAPNDLALLRRREPEAPPGRRGSPVEQAQTGTTRTLPLGASAALTVLAVAAAVLEYPAQNHSNDYLAEQFALNVYGELEPNSIVLTDHWDFYAPSYYLQLVKGIRPDLVLVDRLLVKYPWYVQQLEVRYPWLMDNSRDIVGPYKQEQQRWVNGQPYDAARINQLYFDLLSSFAERNLGAHPAYVFFTSPCDPSQPPQACENNLVAPALRRVPAGLVDRLVAGPAAGAALPPVPKFDLRGYTYDKAPLDDFSKFNAQLYLQTLRTTAQAYAAANKPEAVSLMSQATQLEASLKGR